MQAASTGNDQTTGTVHGGTTDDSAMGTSSDPTVDTIDIAVPLRAEHAATLRLIVASLGSENGLSIDEIDDVKLAVSEVFTLLTDDAEDVGATRAHVAYTATPGTITITLHRGLDDERLVLDTLAETILSSVVDRHVVDNTGVTLVKAADEAHG